MKKVLSALLLLSIVGAAPIYGACARCEWKNCHNDSNWAVRKARSARCAVNRTITRWTRTRNENNNGNVSSNGDSTVTKTCTSKNCPIHNEGKACKNFCNKCGRHHPVR